MSGRFDATFRIAGGIEPFGSDHRAAGFHQCVAQFIAELKKPFGGGEFNFDTEDRIASENHHHLSLQSRRGSDLGGSERAKRRILASLDQGGDGGGAHAFMISMSERW